MNKVMTYTRIKYHCYTHLCSLLTQISETNKLLHMGARTTEFQLVDSRNSRYRVLTRSKRLIPVTNFQYEAFGSYDGSSNHVGYHITRLH